MSRDSRGVDCACRKEVDKRPPRMNVASNLVFTVLNLPAWVCQYVRIFSTATQIPPIGWLCDGVTDSGSPLGELLDVVCRYPQALPLGISKRGRFERRQSRYTYVACGFGRTSHTEEPSVLRGSGH